MLLISIDSASTAVQALSLGRPVSKYSYIFSSKANFNTKYFSEASRSMWKAGNQLSDVIFTHDSWFIGITKILEGTIQGPAQFMLFSLWFVQFNPLPDDKF